MPDSVRASGIRQYVAYQAEEFEQLVKNGFCEDSGMHFEEYAHRWLDRQSWPLIARRWRVLYPYIGTIPLRRLRPINMENLLAKLRK